MTFIECSRAWHTTFPGGRVGALLIGNVDNTPRSSPLDAKKRALETDLRTRFAAHSRADLARHPVLKAYRSYYKTFGNTYHVQGQLESVVWKNKPLPDVSPLVDANFAAELETLVLTAGHDADLLAPPLKLGASQGREVLTQRRGQTKTLRARDMMMLDAEGVVCTLLYGQDARTLISPETRRALYVAYAPAGVPAEAVQRQLETVERNVALVAPDATRERLEIFVAQGDHDKS